MGYTVIAVAALALCPAIAFGQARTTSSSSQPRGTTATASSGEVGGSATVPQAALQAQQDASLIGSPAWWKTHATADGKPLKPRET